MQRAPDGIVRGHVASNFFSLLDTEPFRQEFKVAAFVLGQLVALMVGELELRREAANPAAPDAADSPNPSAG
jgi:hypothetical protein